MKTVLPGLMLLLGFQYQLQAAITNTVETRSNIMNKNIKAVVIKPDHYPDAKALPVVYLLHGYSGNYADWVKKSAGVENLADTYKIIIVCPDGNFGSWYWDSPVDSSFRYETDVFNNAIISFCVLNDLSLL